MPEALLGGYPKGADFGARVGYRTPEGREAFLQYWRAAIDVTHSPSSRARPARRSSSA
jgi:nitrilase